MCLRALFLYGEVMLSPEKLTAKSQLANWQKPGDIGSAGCSVLCFLDLSDALFNAVFFFSSPNQKMVSC